MIKRILIELERHAPFTIVGALLGIVFMFLFKGLPYELSHKVFYILHPAHVLLSAIVTASMYKLFQTRHNGGQYHFLMLLFIGYVGSVGLGTLSDSLMPFLGETLLGLPHAKAHIGFIEEWQLVNSMAIVGVLIAHFWPTTKFPHAGHVFLSTWASLFHIMMATGTDVGWAIYSLLGLFLFLSVWLPCCFGDIIFPLLFAKGNFEEASHLTHCSCPGTKKQTEDNAKS